MGFTTFYISNQYFFQEEDNIPPQYEILSETGCSSNIGFSNCDTENWALEAIVHDNETGKGWNFNFYF